MKNLLFSVNFHLFLSSHCHLCLASRAIDSVPCNDNYIEKNSNSKIVKFCLTFVEPLSLQSKKSLEKEISIG